MFGYVIVPAIYVRLPIRLGASKQHLAEGAAHVEGTALPVGGVGTRSVIAGHRGGATNNFFLFRDRLKSGDRIYLIVQGELLIYEVYGTEIIMPWEWEKLAAIEGQDSLTLLTCTIPPMNTERLLDARRVERTASPTQPTAGPSSHPTMAPTTAGKSAVDELRTELRAAESSGALDPAFRNWQWATRAAILLLALALVLVVWRLSRLLTRGLAAARSQVNSSSGPTV